MTAVTIWLTFTMDDGLIHRDPSYRQAIEWAGAQMVGVCNPRRLRAGLYEVQAGSRTFYIATPKQATAEGFEHDGTQHMNRWQVPVTRTDGSVRTITLDWIRRERDLDLEHRSKWVYTDPEGGEWKIEFGYNGADFGLFGPAGSPFGKTLDRTVVASQERASRYIAEVIVRADDRTADRAGRD